MVEPVPGAGRTPRLEIAREGESLSILVQPVLKTAPSNLDDERQQLRAALAHPLWLTGTPDQLDRELPRRCGPTPTGARPSGHRVRSGTRSTTPSAAPSRPCRPSVRKRPSRTPVSRHTGQPPAGGHQRHGGGRGGHGEHDLAGGHAARHRHQPGFPVLTTRENLIMTERIVQAATRRFQMGCLELPIPRPASHRKRLSDYWPSTSRSAPAACWARRSAGTGCGSIPSTSPR